MSSGSSSTTTQRKSEVLAKAWAILFARKLEMITSNALLVAELSLTILRLLSIPMNDPSLGLQAVGIRASDFDGGGSAEAVYEYWAEP